MCVCVRSEHSNDVGDSGLRTMRSLVLEAVEGMGSAYDLIHKHCTIVVRDLECFGNSLICNHYTHLIVCTQAREEWTSDHSPETTVVSVGYQKRNLDACR